MVVGVGLTTSAPCEWNSLGARVGAALHANAMRRNCVSRINRGSIAVSQALRPEPRYGGLLLTVDHEASRAAAQYRA